MVMVKANPRQRAGQREQETADPPVPWLQATEGVSTWQARQAWSLLTPCPHGLYPSGVESESCMETGGKKDGREQP